MSLTSRPHLRHANHANKGELTTLLVRTARGDRAAFAGLHAQLRPVLDAQLAAVPLHPADVIAVTDATFVEVWRLAGRCPDRETDALAWVRGIAARRAADRWLARTALRPEDDQPMDVLATIDRQIEAELAALLATTPGAGHGH